MNYYKNKYVIALYDYKSKEIATVCNNVSDLSEWLNKKPKTIYLKLYRAKEGVFKVGNDIKLYYKCIEKDQSCPKYYTRSKKVSDDSVANFLLHMGFPPHIKGFDYLVEAIKTNSSFFTIDELFIHIAKKFGTTKDGVNRAIYFLITKYWEDINTGFAKYNVDGGSKPTTKRVIKTLKYIYDKEHKNNE